MKCPNCNAEIWDFAFGPKLNKCWNCMLAFDNESVEANIQIAQDQSGQPDPEE